MPQQEKYGGSLASPGRLAWVTSFRGQLMGDVQLFVACRGAGEGHHQTAGVGGKKVWELLCVSLSLSCWRLMAVIRARCYSFQRARTGSVNCFDSGSVKYVWDSTEQL